MGTVEIFGIAVFGLLVLGALMLSIRQGANQRTLERWRAPSVMLVERPPRSVYLFGFQASLKARPSSRASRGYSCLAEHDDRRHDSAVTILTRTPGLEKLMPEVVEAGGEDFRRKFIVTCRDASSALAAVNGQTEQLLPEHDSDPGWHLTVTIGGRAVPVSSFWAQSESEWDYLVALAKKLRAELR